VADPLLRIQGFLSNRDCLTVRRAMDDGVREEAEVLRNGIHRQELVRNAELIEPAADVIDQIEASLESCRPKLREAFGRPLGSREGAGFIRYHEGGFYRPHRDRGDEPGWEGAARRAVALVLFLNTSRDSGAGGEFDGGVLRLFLPDGDVDVAPEAGLLVAFQTDVLHEVTEVLSGARDTVVDWFYDVSATSA
jgi:predicted 2-oxoglutarate/Fe(II)-dependent dioxygenase YbiX